MKHCPISFAEFGWIWTDSVALYTSQFILLNDQWAISFSLSPYFPPLIILLRVDPKICFSDLWWSFRCFLTKSDLAFLFFECNQWLAPCCKGLVAVFTVMNESHSGTHIFSRVLLTLNRCCEIVFLNRWNKSEHQIIQFRCFLFFKNITYISFCHLSDRIFLGFQP